MGAINFTIDTDLIDFLKSKLQLTNFVETGTYKGESLEKVLSKFDKLFSCEIDNALYERVKEKFQGNSKVKIYNQNSPDFIKKIIAYEEGVSTLYWLDAHFTAESESDKDLSKCPLLQEVEAIGSIGDDCVVIIDDARYFLTPPPPPNDFTNWPEFTAIINSLNKLNSNYRFVVWNDVLIFFPIKIKNDLFVFLSTRSFDVLKVIDRAKEYPVLISEIKKKETEISELKIACLEKDNEILKKENEINAKENEITSKESEIKNLLHTCEERRLKIDLINLKLKNLEEKIKEKDIEIRILNGNGTFF